MGKDPAFLFYPNDWLGGTMGMSFEEKGAYIELLMMQFNKGKFTEAQARQVLSICPSTIWHLIKTKFKTDGTYYWNERLEAEMIKRKEFTESRRKNALGNKKEIKGDEHMLQHMENENENININEDANESKGGAGGNLTREEQLAIYQKFTTAILQKTDHHFEQLAMHEHITITPDAVKDHLALLCRYPNMQPNTLAEFRQSLIKHCKEFKIKTDGTKPKDEFLGTFNLTKARKNMADYERLDELEREKNNIGTNG